MEFKECPFCKEEIKEGAFKCKHCKSMLGKDEKNGAEVDQKEYNPAIKAYRPVWKKWFVWVPLCIIVIALIVAISGASLTGGSKDAMDDMENKEEVGSKPIEIEGTEETEPESKPGSNGNSSSEPVTLESIIDKYEPRFQALEDNITAELKTLFNAALKEFEQGGGPLQQLQLANKYMGKIQEIEKQADASFYNLLEEMEHELLGHGLPTEVITEIEEDYKKEKQAKKRELTNFISEWGNW